jgi:hypothetical protein
MHGINFCCKVHSRWDINEILQLCEIGISYPCCHPVSERQMLNCCNSDTLVLPVENVTSKN